MNILQTYFKSANHINRILLNTKNSSVISYFWWFKIHQTSWKGWYNTKQDQKISTAAVLRSFTLVDRNFDEFRMTIILIRSYYIYAKTTKLCTSTKTRLCTVMVTIYTSIISWKKPVRMKIEIRTFLRKIRANNHCKQFE